MTALSTRLSQPLQGTQKVELVSADPRLLATEALRELSKNLEATAEAQAAVAEHLQAGETAAGINGSASFSRHGRSASTRCANANRVLGTDLTQRNACGGPIYEHVEALNNRLRELRDAFESRDMVLLADIVQYELPELCRTWRDILSELADAVDSRTQPV